MPPVGGAGGLRQGGGRGGCRLPAGAGGLPAPGPPRHRRNGDGVRGGAPPHRAPRRSEDAGPGARLRGDAATVPARRTPRGERESPAQPLRLRVGGDRGPPGDHHGDRGERHPRGSPEEAGALSGGGGGGRDPRRDRGTGSGVCAGGAASRRETLQLLRRSRRDGEGGGLRAVGVDDGARRLLRHRGGDDHGHPRVRRAGAAARGRVRRARRSVFGGGDAVHPAHRSYPLRRRERGAGGGERGEPAAEIDHRVPRRRPRAAAEGDRPPAREGTGGAVRQLPGAAGCAAALQLPGAGGGVDDAAPGGGVARLPARVPRPLRRADAPGGGDRAPRPAAGRALAVRREVLPPALRLRLPLLHSRGGDRGRGDRQAPEGAAGGAPRRADPRSRARVRAHLHPHLQRRGGADARLDALRQELRDERGGGGVVRDPRQRLRVGSGAPRAGGPARERLGDAVGSAQRHARRGRTEGSDAPRGGRHGDARGGNRAGDLRPVRSARGGDPGPVARRARSPPPASRLAPAARG